MKTSDLPTYLPLLPVHGTVLLPRTQLPVPISQGFQGFSFLLESLKFSKMIGVVQPVSSSYIPQKVELFRSGCVGNIADISEMEDGRLMVTIAGICRFSILNEITNDKGYKEAEVSYKRYEVDMVEEVDFSFDRERLMKALNSYFKTLDITPNWQEICNTSDERLITALTMVCPFDPREKQVLLEAPTLQEQSKIITTMVEMAALESPQGSFSSH